MNNDDHNGDDDIWAESPQFGMFDDLKNDWRKEWQDMPEYSHNELGPMKSVIIHFADECDLEAFAKLLGQNIYMTTKSTWFPKAEWASITDKRYVDET
jgi:hypothetical protein